MGINKVVMNTENGEQVLIDLTNDNINADGLIVGHTAHGSDGEIITGANPYELEATNTEVQTQADLIEQIQTALIGKAAGGGSEPVIEPLNITENGTYTAPDGVDGYSPVTVNVASSGGGSGSEDGIIDRSIADCSNARVTSIGNGAFAQCALLETVSFPNVININNNAFYPCVKLTTATFPKATSIGNYSFRGCTKLAQIDLPLLETMGTYAFYQNSNLASVNLPLVQSITANAFGACSKLKTADFSSAINIDANAFYKCSVLTALILRNTNAICTLSNINAFTGTPIENGTGYIYVPSSLLSQYQSASNWANFSSQFRAIEDYPDICGEV